MTDFKIFDLDNAPEKGRPLLEKSLKASGMIPNLHGVARSRGNVSEQATSTFLEAGFNQQNILEIVLILAQKVMSNYTNHLAETPLDKPFQKFAWEKSAAHA